MNTGFTRSAVVHVITGNHAAKCALVEREAPKVCKQGKVEYQL